MWRGEKEEERRKGEEGLEVEKEFKEEEEEER